MSAMRSLRVLIALALLALAPPATAADKAPLYYQHPSGKPDYSPVPKKDQAGRDYLPVYQEPAAAAPSAEPSRADAAASGKECKPLYYRNPLGLPDTSPVPKKDSMGMAYIPVCADDAGATGTVKIAPERLQTLIRCPHRSGRVEAACP